MARQILRSMRAPLTLRAARWQIAIPVVVGAMAITTTTVSLSASTRDSAASYTEAATPAVRFARLTSIPSHNGAFRASLLAPQEDVADTWTIAVQTSAGNPVDGATLALENWMPDTDQVPATHPRVTRALGGGRYRVEGIRFDRQGWWNVRLRIATAGEADSLAFNLVR